MINFRKLQYSALGVSMLTLVGCTGMGEARSNVEAPGESVGAKARLLEAGASAMQTDEPPSRLEIYLVGFHPLKQEPVHQFEAHHFCDQVNEDFLQCALYDGNSGDAKLNGIEYIISEELFERLPEEEKQYWHPHNGEILSGQLVAPNLPQAAEHELMKSKINSYGKTWHTWDTAQTNSAEASLPLGEPSLAWSFNRDGEANPGLIEERDEDMNIDTAERRRARQDLVPLAKPQSGVDALHGEFPRPTSPIPGVEAKP
ncbi:OBAP family protein [Marinobacter sp. TBZ242]|uniref:OBAP family protein n=1 Tax=Marinobacter azerbaijanicus TaxID=3050455 RepID=A0ABT7IHW4_9GAMM|nr:OBAP family protein [Marinobacter sp. TBZ242]MDL0433735.1 OBAP family protein [Marinobacter sp. TBZ242]